MSTTASVSEIFRANEVNQTFLTKVLYPEEDPIPNPEPADGYQTFASCMLLMDDNHRLTEWMAYHYHVLPLRYMIVTIDPRSKTSPSVILNQWRRQGVYIEEWTDRDFWKTELKPIPDDAELQLKRDRHRGRQKYFYRKCMIHLKEQNRTWVALNDSDEFIVYNHPGGVKKSQGNIPSTAEAGGMIRYIRQQQEAGIEYFQSPCLGIPRLTFGAEESDEADASKLVPDDFDSFLFDTLWWRKHAQRDDFVKNALGKVIMDVSRIDVAASPLFMSLHRPIKTICSAPWHRDADSGLRINHYLGSWESYTIRDDSRRGNERSLEMWEYKATTNGEETDDSIRPWLGGFVSEHGTDKAKELLRFAGLPRGYKNTNYTAWRLLPDKLAKILSTDVTKANDSKAKAFDAWVRKKYKGYNNPLTAKLD